MHIFLKIGDDKTYTPHEFKGRYALELAIVTICDVYFGREIRDKVEAILKSPLAESEIEKNIKQMRELRINNKRF